MFEFDRIETPENVELERRLAGIGSRFIAGLLDHLIMIAVIAIVIVVLVLLDVLDVLTDLGGGVGWWGFALMLVAGVMIQWGYFVFFEAVMHGQTPGKRRMSIRVVKEGGGAVSLLDNVVRNLLRVVDGLGAYAVAGISMFSTRRTQRLGDLAAGTVVISEQTADYSARTDRRTTAQTWDRDVSADALRATGLHAEEYRALANYWARRGQLTLEARMRVLPRLFQPILERGGWADQQWPLERLEAYLEQILAESDAAEGGAAGPGGTT